MALVDAPFDEALLRRQVEDVELVDPWRHDQKRPLENGFGGRVVLDHLAEFALGDHLAGRHGEVLADLELAVIGVAKAKLAAAGRHVLCQHPHAVDEVRAARRDRVAVDLGIGEGEIGGRERRRQLAGVEYRLHPRVVVEAFRFQDQLFGEGGGHLIDLPEEGEERVPGPVLVGEALVTGRCLGRCDRLSGHLRDGSRPDLHVAGEEECLRLQRPLRVGHPVSDDVRERPDKLGHGIGGMVLDLGLVMGSEPRTSGPSEVFEGPGEVDGERVGILDHIGFDGLRVECGKLAGAGFLSLPLLVQLLLRRPDLAI